MDPSLIIAIAALVGGPVGGYFALRGKRGDQKVTVEANLTVGQQAFIDRLDKANIEQAGRIREMNVEIDALKRQVYELQQKFDAAEDKLGATYEELTQTRAELEAEREARRAGEDAGKQRQKVSEERIEALNGSIIDPPTEEETS